MKTRTMYGIEFGPDPYRRWNEDGGCPAHGFQFEDLDHGDPVCRGIAACTGCGALWDCDASGACPDCGGVVR